MTTIQLKYCTQILQKLLIALITDFYWINLMSMALTMTCRFLLNRSYKFQILRNKFHSKADKCKIVSYFRIRTKLIINSCDDVQI